MTRNLSIIPIFVLILSSCGETTGDNGTTGLKIDPKIKIEAEKHFVSSKEFDAFKDKVQVYGNSVWVENYKNDSLTFSSNDTSNKQVFKSFYLWKGDTLSIVGAFGLFEGVGFVINLHNKKATLFHMLSSDFPTYAYNQNDSLIDRLEVPCATPKVILSEIPDSTKTQIIYGYVEFKSGDYYSSAGSADGHEILPRTKQRTNMKIYFKSGRLDL